MNNLNQFFDCYVKHMQSSALKLKEFVLSMAECAARNYTSNQRLKKDIAVYTGLNVGSREILPNRVFEGLQSILQAGKKPREAIHFETQVVGREKQRVRRKWSE